MGKIKPPSKRNLWLEAFQSQAAQSERIQQPAWHSKSHQAAALEAGKEACAQFDTGPKHKWPLGTISELQGTNLQASTSFWHNRNDFKKDSTLDLYFKKETTHALYFKKDIRLDLGREMTPCWCGLEHVSTLSEMPQGAAG